MDDQDDDSTALSERLGHDPDQLTTLLGHFYRGEMDRTSSWRGRLDGTTNWAVTVLAAVLTWVFSGTDNPHYVLLIGMLTILLFHYVDTRRYRAYDVWRSRVRLVEEDVLAAAIDPDADAEHADWRHELGEDLRRPALKTPFGEAYARRLRRVYLPLLVVLLAAWVARITVFTPDQGALETAAIVGVPGPVVVGGVALFYLAALAVAFWPRQRQAMGELYEREKEGEWKGE